MAATGRKTIFITLGAPAVLTLKVADNAAYNNPQYIVKHEIRDFRVTFNRAPGDWYPYRNQCMAFVRIHDEGEWSFELQDVDAVTHPTWVTGTQAACDAFLADLAAAL